MVAWDSTRVDGQVYFASEKNAQTDWLKMRHKNYVGGSPADFSYTLDNNGVERKFFKDDFSNDTLGQYTVTGSPTIAAGVLTMAYSDKIIKTLDTGATTGKWEAVIQWNTAIGANEQRFYLYIGYNSALRATRSPTTNSVSLRFDLEGVQLIASTPTGINLADNTYCHIAITYDGTNYQMYYNGTAVGSATAGAAPVTPSIGCWDTDGVVEVTAMTINEITYTPSVAYTDLFAADTETRYMQLVSNDALATWTGATAGGWVIAGGVLTIKGSDADEGLLGALRSYNFGSGSYQISAINNNLTTATPDSFGIVFGYQDSLNRHKAVVEEWGPSSSTPYGFKIYKTVAGTTTQLGTTAAVTASNYTRGATCYFRIDWDVPKGRIWGYISATPDDWRVGVPAISDAFDATFAYGKVGVIDTTTTTGSAGKLNVVFDNLTVRAALLIGGTNIPATETGFYFRDEFAVNSIGRYAGYTTPNFTITGGSLSVVGTGASRSIVHPISVKNPTIIWYITNNITGTGNFICVWGSEVPYSSTIGGTRYMLYYTASNAITLYKYVNGVVCTADLTGWTSVSSALSDNVQYKITVTFTSDSVFTINIIKVSDSSVVTNQTVTDTNASGAGLLNAGCAGIGYSGSYTYGTWTLDDFIISGTRYYMKPMLRGAQVGEYYVP